MTDHTDLIKRLRGLYESGHGHLYHWAQEAADEIEKLRADAERYRYLRNRDAAYVLKTTGPAAGCWIDCDDEDGELTLLTGEDADAAIDAARGAK